MSADGTVTPQLFRYGSEGELIDSIAIPSQRGSALRTAFYRLGTSGGRMLRGLNHVPFAALPVWDVGGAGSLYLAKGAPTSC